ncbi:MAG: ABC transporter ATP-binding protein [Candidatus Competibacteraceae bacterium]|jgi:branched-chain amino acid transport system ATP-binding protein|nr:ABC transporter ATP-binding protein [Candidatus Competibacteraceae bacterium]
MSLLRVENLSKSFGGVDAIADLSFAIQVGAIHAVIGPNGAGKTTLFNMITGLYQPTRGAIFLEEHNIVGQAPYTLAKRGLSRTFQNLQICMNMTAVENVMVGRHLHLNRSFIAAMLRLPIIVRGDRQCREKAAELMEFVGVGKYVKTDANAMPYGALKRLEIARALAAEPKVLLLDEPAAGLNAKETAEIDQLIQKIATTGVTVVLVEHDMKLVMNISDYLLVLDFGKKLAEGTPDEISNNPDVIAAYLGGG